MVSPTVLVKLTDQLQKVEELMVGISRSNGFAADWVCLEMQRRALLNAITLCRTERRKKIVDFDLWRKAAIELNAQLSHWMCPPFTGTGRMTSADASLATESQTVTSATPSSGA
jgi:hypothetical protein